jgi:hypothetical protein
MKKSLIIKSVIMEIETDEKIEPGEQVLFEEDFIISSGNFIKQETGKVLFYDHSKLYESFGRKPESIIFYTATDLNNQEPVKTIETKNTAGRISTVEEQKLINDFTFSRDQIENPFLPFFISFDVSENFVLVFGSNCSIEEHTDGKKVVLSFSERFAIKHGIVYEYNEKNDFDDFDEDITEINDLLK